MNIITKNDKRITVREYPTGGFDVWQRGNKVMECDGTGRARIRGNMRARFASYRDARRFVMEAF